MLAFALTPAHASAAAVVVAAGDIACSPASTSFNHGLGTFGTDPKCHQKYTSDLFESLQPTAILPLGDTQYGSATHRDFLDSYDRRDVEGNHMSWGRAKSITRPSVGNHEYAETDPATGAYTGASGYFDYFNGVGSPSGPAGDRDKGYYSYDLTVATRPDGSPVTWHLVAINSLCAATTQLAGGNGWLGGCAEGSAQERWLREDLQAAAATTDCTLAYWHHPRFSATGGGDNPVMSATWQSLLDNYADVVLSGHHHNYQRFGPLDATGSPAPGRGIRQFIVGTGGKSLGSPPSLSRAVEAFDNTAFGVLKLTLHDRWYEWEFVPDGYSGAFRDSGTGECLQPPPTIDAGPQGLTGAGPVSFEFSPSGSTSRFECRLDGSAWQACASPARYPELTDGDHSFAVRPASITGTAELPAAERQFSVDTTPPGVSALAPGLLSGLVTLDANANDAHSVSVVRWLLDGAVIASDDAPPWSQPWDSASVADGGRHLQAQAVDAAGNVGWSAVVPVTIDNAPKAPPPANPPTAPPATTEVTAPPAATEATAPPATTEATAPPATTLPATPLRASARITSGRRLRTLRQHGATLRVKCSRPCSVATRLMLPARTAKRLGLPRAIASTTDRRLRRSRSELTVELNPAARRRSDRLRSVKLTLSVIATDAAQESRVLSSSVVFR